MGVIVLEGLAVTVLVLVGFREAVMNAIPLSLKRAIGAGIGLFILFIGFVNGGLIASTGLTPGRGPGRSAPVFPTSPGQFVFLFGLAPHGRSSGRGGSGRPWSSRSWARRSSRSSPASRRSRRR